MFIIKKKEPPSSCIDSKIQSGPQDAVYSQVQLRQLLLQSNVARCHFRSFRLKQANCIIIRKKKNEECLFSISKLSFRLHCKHTQKKTRVQLCISQQAGGSMGRCLTSPLKKNSG